MLPETYVCGNDIIIGKISPELVHTEQHKKAIFKDCSQLVRSSEEGIIDKVVETQNADGYKLVKVRVRSERIPTVGDKFTSRSGQKATCGIVMEQEDMPFSEDSGISPDLLINSHCLPSRMTISQPIECLMAKAGALDGKYPDMTPFEKHDTEWASQVLLDNGFDQYGEETFYNGMTGKQFRAKIFIGPTYYLRLKHMVQDKCHARARGPVQTLTRQPLEGRSRDGGLRLGEMEVQALVAHGVSQFLVERLVHCSDKYETYVCDDCGLIGNMNFEKNRFTCTHCPDASYSKVCIPYAYKLLYQELMSIGIVPRMFTS